MKRIVKVISAAVAVAILFVQPLAYALADGIVDLGGSVGDANAGLEWLDLDIPAPCSPDDIVNGVEGCDFLSEGWMLASSAQVDEFLSNSGVSEGIFLLGTPEGQVAEELMLVLGPTNVVLDPLHLVTEIWGITSTAGTATGSQDTRAISIFEPLDGAAEFVYVYGDAANLDGNPVFQPDPPDDVVISYWFVREASAERLLADLVSTVVDLNLNSGLGNALDRKLQNALDALDMAQLGDNPSAIRIMHAFMHSVEAQRDKALSEEEADELAAAAETIILFLQGASTTG
jgi:hypothetical protein